MKCNSTKCFNHTGTRPDFVSHLASVVIRHNNMAANTGITPLGSVIGIYRPVQAVASADVCSHVPLESNIYLI